MSDGEYDIFGNLIKADSKSSKADAPEEALVIEEPQKLFAVGDKVDVKEGGKVFRKATVLKYNEKSQELDLQYDDGETESGVPINLIKLGSRVPAAAPAPPPGMSAPPSEAEDSGKGVPRKERKSKKDRTAEESMGRATIFSSKARQCYEMIKTFSEAEQDAALAMIKALDSVRASHGSILRSEAAGSAISPNSS